MGELARGRSRPRPVRAAVGARFLDALPAVGLAVALGIFTMVGGLAYRSSSEATEMIEAERAQLGDRSAATLESLRAARRNLAVGFASASSVLLLAFMALRREMAARERSTAALQESEAKLATTLQSIGDAVISTDVDAAIVRMNPAAEELAGCSSQEAAGRPFREVFPLVDEETREPVASPIERALGPAASGPRTVCLEGHDRERRIADGASALRDEVGRVVGAVVVLRDVTAEKAAETRFRKLLEAAPDAMIIADSTGRIVLANAQAARLFGYEQGDLVGRTVEALMPARYRQRHAGHRQRYGETPTARPMGVGGLELFGLRRDGSEFPAEISLSPLELPEGALAITAIRDVTQRKQDEAALRRAMGDAERVSRELEAFSYSVAHDLRAPLRGIDGFAQALLEDHAYALDEEGRDYLGRVRAGAQRMGRIIDDLLALSRVTRSELVREDVSLTAIAREIGARLAAAHPARSVILDVEDDLRVNADPRLLGIALENLLGNAWKFTSRRAEAHIQVGVALVPSAPAPPLPRDAEQGAAPRSAPHAPGTERAFFVRDDGAGFDMAYAGKLFGAFKRLHSTTEFEGTGIGLATVQRIIARHGGRVWAEAAEQRGATFYFTLGQPQSQPS